MNLQEFSSYVPDVGSEKNQVYTVEEIVFIAMVSVLCGAETWNEIEIFGNSHEEYFKNRLPHLSGIPSEDTFNRFSLCWILNGLKKFSAFGLMIFAVSFPVSLL